MLRIVDKNGHTKFILNDEDEKPLSIDEIIIQETNQSKEEEEKKKE